MAIVNDPFDPQGLGMFSKAGRFTSEKYIIFQKKNEILYDKRKTFNVSSYPGLDDKQKKTKETQIENILEKQKQNEIKKQEEKQKKEEIQPFQKMLSREKINETKQVKNPPPPIGYYHPRFIEIDPRPKFCWDIVKQYNKSVNHLQQTKSLIERVNPQHNDDEIKPIPERLRKRQLGLVELQRQTARSEFFQPLNNAHHLRFEHVYESQELSKMRKTLSFNMRQKLGREKNNMYQNKEFAPDYNPNFEYGKKKMAIKVPNFNRTLERKPLNKQLNDIYQKEINYDSIMRNTRNIVFDKMLKKDDGGQLPSFMQKNVTSRQQLQTLNQKMLEMNNYQDSKFQSIYSSFGSTMKNKVKENNLEDSLSIEVDH